MKSVSFFEEVISFVNNFWPAAEWDRSNGLLILKLNHNNKTLGFISDYDDETLGDNRVNYRITECNWRANKEATQSRICSLLGATERIHARQCLIKKISKAQARIFVDANHIMGYAEAAINYGLFLKDDLVAVTCFSKGRKMNRLPKDKKSFELIRFCNLNFHTVVGGLSRLIRHFETEHQPGDIMTYVDKSWGDPKTYHALGFVTDTETAGEHIINRNHKLIKHQS